MEKTEIGPSQLCVDCIFQEILDDISSCRFYPKYKNMPFPMARGFITKPVFCRVKKIVVYEELLETTWGGPDFGD